MRTRADGRLATVDAMQSAAGYFPAPNALAASTSSHGPPVQAGPGTCVRCDNSKSDVDNRVQRGGSWTRHCKVMTALTALDAG